MVGNCVWCDLDGRAGCPVHYRRDWAFILTVVAMIVLLAAVFGLIGFITEP